MFQRLRAIGALINARVKPDASRWYSIKTRIQHQLRRTVGTLVTFATAAGLLIGAATPALAEDFQREFSNSDSQLGTNPLIIYNSFTYKNQVIFGGRVQLNNAIFAAKADGTLTTLLGRTFATDTASGMGHAVLNGMLYMVLQDYTGATSPYGTELYKYDGSTLTRVGDWFAGISNFFTSGAQALTVMNNELWFFGNNGTNTGLYHWDGVAAAPSFVPGTSGLTGTNITALGNNLYFGASRGLGIELYKFDGSSVSLAANIAADTNGVTDSYVSPDTGSTAYGSTCNASGRGSNFPIANNYLFFYARRTGQSYRDLYAVGTDGVVSTVVASNNQIEPSCPVAYDNAAYFVANIDPTNTGFELYKWTGAGTSPTLAIDMVSGSGGIGQTQLSSWQGKLYINDNETVQKVRVWTAGSGSTAAATSVLVSGGTKLIFPEGTNGYGVSSLAWMGGLFAPYRTPTHSNQAGLFLNFDAAAPTLDTIVDKSVSNGTVSIAAPTLSAGTANGWQATGLPAGLMMNEQTGVITGNTTATGTYAVTVTALNNNFGSPAASSSKTYNLTLTATAPALSATQTVKFVKGSAGTFPVANFNTGGAVTTYSATSLPAGLSINASTGLISGTATTLGTSDYTVTATNASGTSSMTLTSSVIPKPLMYSSVNAALAASTCTVNVACTVLAAAPALTETSGLTLTYSSNNLPAGMNVDSATGAITGTPTSMVTNLPIVVNVTDGYSTAQFSKVITVNDAAPVIASYGPLNFTQNAAVSGLSLPATTGGTPLQYVTGTVPTNSGWTYTNLPAGLSVSTTAGSITGLITGTPTVAGTFSNVTVTAHSYGNVASTAYTFTINVAAVAPVLQNYTPSTQQVGVAVSLSPSTNMLTAGTPSSWSISPALPSGLSMNTSTGAITGTPASGTAQLSTAYTVTATNSLGSATGTLNLRIDDAVPVLSPATAITTTVPIGSYYQYTPFSRTGGSTVTNWTFFGNTPTGLTMNSSTGEVTGYPTSSYSSKSISQTISVRACPAIYTNTSISCTTINWTYTYTNGAPLLTGPTSLDFVNGNSIGSADMNAKQTSLTGSFWSIASIDSWACALDASSPALPTGLSISTSSGCYITGTPTGVNGKTAVTTNVVLKMSNTYGSATQTIAVKVYPKAPALNVAPTLTFPLNASYTYTPVTLTPSDSTGTVASYSISPDLPTGLTLNSTTGVISGTATVAQPQTSYTYTLTNANPIPATYTAKITIAVVVPTLSTTWMSTSAADGCGGNLCVGKYYSFAPPTQTAGSPIDSWAIATGTLPAGLSLNATTGYVTGTPTTAVSNNTVSIKATNTAGSSTAVSSTKTVGKYKPNLTSAGTIVLQRGVPYSYTFTSIGNPATSCVKSSGVLPTGLSVSFSGGTCVISGTPSALQDAALLTLFADNANTDGTYSNAYPTVTYSVISSPPTLAALTDQSVKQGASVTSPTYSLTGDPVSSWSATGLPPGISINAVTGVLSGIFTTAGTFASTITASNSGGTSSQNITFTVAAVDAPVLTNPGTHYITLGNSVDLTIANSGSASTFALKSGSNALPTGLSLNTSTGQITGTPSSEQSMRNVTITATNTMGTAEVTFSIGVVQPLAILAAVNPIQLVQGVNYSGGTAIPAPINTGGVISSWSASNLPTGLSINSTTGVVSGTPTGYQDATDATITATTTGGDTSIQVSFAVARVYAPSLTNPGTHYITIGTSSPFTIANSGSAATFTITSGTLPTGFSLDANTGEISGSSSVEQASRNVTIMATNYSGNQSVTFSIGTVQPLAILANLADQTLTQGVSYTHVALANTGGVISSWSASNLPAGLLINSTTGVISGTPTGYQDSTNATITATTTGGDTSQQVAFAVARIYAPALTNPGSQVVTMGNALTITTSNSGSNATWTASGLPAHVSINSSTGVISGTPTDERAAANVTVTATNYTGTDSVTFTLAVNQPAPVLGSVSSQSFVQGDPGQMNAPNNTGGSNVTWSASGLPIGLSINSSTGLISGTPTTQQASTDATITATNSGGVSAITVAFEITPTNPPALTNPGAQVFTVGDSVSFTIANSGSHATWSVASGTLPAGLSLNAATGRISGTPTQENSVSAVTLEATNYTGTDSITFNIAINLPAPVLGGLSNQTLTLGVPFSLAAAANTGGPVATWTASGLPASLSLNSSTGVISGTPSALQTVTTAIITATNSGGSDTTTLTFTVNDVIPALGTYSAAVITKGIAITTISATTNTGGPVVTWTSSDLPSGLSIDATNGEITGIPDTLQATTLAHVTATNSGGSDTATISFTVNDVVPSLGSLSAQTYTKGTAIGGVLAPTNSGGPVVTWSSTDLPAGLTISSSTGEITGTPTALQSVTTSHVTATNTGGSDTTTIDITVVDVVPSLTAYQAITVTKGIAMTATSTPANSGGPVVTWSSTDLPAGLSLNSSTGVISGTASALQTVTATHVTATNTGGSDTTTIDITVIDKAPVLDSMAAVDLTLGQAITAISHPQVSGLGGDVGTWSSTDLPAGLLIDSRTGEITGTPTSLRTATNATITGTNTGGTGTTTILFTVNDVVPSLGSLSAITLTKGHVMAGVSAASNSGGPVVTWSSSDLPAGLTISSSTGEITGTPSALQSATTSHVTATNSGGSNTTTISITVNDVVPLLTAHASVRLTIGVAASDIAAPVNAGGPVVTWSSDDLPAGLTIDASTGVISGTPTDLQAATDSHITATNSGGSDTVILSIAVVDVAPTITGSYTGTRQFTITIDSNSIDAPTHTGLHLVWSAVNLPTGMSIDSDTGVISGTPTTLINPTNATVTATNSGGSASTVFAYQVNDFTPQLNVYPQEYEFTIGDSVSIPAPQNFGGPAVSWSIDYTLPQGLSLNTSTGEISGTATRMATRQGYTVTATNSGGSHASSVFIGVVDHVPSFVPLPTLSITRFATIQPIDLAALNAGGQVTNWVSTDLPAGLSIDATTGLITGTPQDSQVLTTSHIIVKNSGGQSDISLDIEVVDVAPALHSSLGTQTPTQFEPFSFDLARANIFDTHSGHVATWSAAGLPDGLAIDAVSGVISGTPTSRQLASATITATNAQGSSTASLDFTIAPVNRPSLTQGISSQAYTIGKSYLLRLTNSSDLALSWSASGVPTYCTFTTSVDLTSSTVACSPTVETAAQTVTITATNHAGSGTTSFTIAAVHPLPVFNALTGTALRLNQFVHLYAPTVTGGPVASWSATGVPAGMTFDSTTGALEGAPTTLNSDAVVTYSATNSGGTVSADVHYFIIDNEPILQSISNQTYTLGHAITPLDPRIGLTGGPANSWVISNLPDGLEFDPSTGIISGTPTQLTDGAQTVQVGAVNTGCDGISCGYKLFKITVNDVPPTLAAPSDVTYTVGRDITPVQIQTTGGGPVVSWSWEDHHTLPGGLTFDASTGVISGRPIEIVGTQTYVVTARNSGGSGTTTITLTVNDVAPDVNGYLNGLVLTKGRAIAQPIAHPVVSQFGGAVVSWSSTDLPSGLTIDATTGEITGTPTTLQTSTTAHINATNSGGSTTVPLNIVVNDVAPTVAMYPSQRLTMGTQVTIAAPAHTGGDVVTWSVVDSLPNGLTLNPTTGEITGTPDTAQPATLVRIRAENTGGAANTSVTITVSSAPVLAAINDVVINSRNLYSLSVSNTGGAVITSDAAVGIALWQIASGALPTGLTINAQTGAITGSAIVDGSYSATIRATNYSGRSDRTINFLVDTTAPTISQAQVTQDGSIQVVYSEAIYSSIGASSFTVLVAGSSAAISSAQVMANTLALVLVTPVTAGQVVTLSYGATAIQDLQGVNSAAINRRTVTNLLVTLSYPQPSLCPQVGSITPTATCVQMSSPMSTIPATAVGFISTPRYSIQPALPAGLTLNESTGAIAGTPSIRTSETTYSVTATSGSQSASATFKLKVIFTPSRPISGSTGVSINSAATWTNTTAVTLSIVWPQGASFVQVSNDGGMTTSSNFDLAATIPWTLESSQSSSAQRSVYVRFLDTDGNDLAQNSSAFSDDIEMDNTAPAVSTVTAAANTSGAVTVSYAVTDNIGGSGVAAVQVSDAPDSAATSSIPATGIGTTFASGTMSINDPMSTSIYLRVRDLAGNFSGWTSQMITLPPPPPVSKTGDNVDGGEVVDTGSIAGPSGTSNFTDGSGLDVSAAGVIMPRIKSSYIGSISGTVTVTYFDVTTHVRTSWVCKVAAFGNTKKNPKLKVNPKTKKFPLVTYKPKVGCAMPAPVLAARDVSLIGIATRLTFVRLYPTTGLAMNPVGKKKIKPVIRIMRLSLGVRPS